MTVTKIWPKSIKRGKDISSHKDRKCKKIKENMHYIHMRERKFKK